MTLKREAYRMLQDIVGPEYISEDPAVLDGYTWQWMGEFQGEIASRFMPHRPEVVITPGSAEEVQAIVKICNRYGLKFKAHSTGWGAWGGAGVEGVVLLDLRRLNKIIEINEEDMYAVVEPYVIWAQLQAEAMKKGLNCCTIGAGSNTSALASCTAQEGVGYNNVSMGYNARNVLGVEWVLPDGEILRLGSLGSGAGWISGDGPGPSLRGIMRGSLGSQGGLGVFTKCAVRLYHWGGPPELQSKNIVPADERLLEFPENVKIFFLHFKSYEDRDRAFLKIGESEVAYAAALFGRGLMTLGIGRDNRESIELRETLAPAIPPIALTLLLVANSTRELKYQEKVINKILEETSGENLDLITENPDTRDVLALLLIKGGNAPAKAVFGLTGGFTPTLCHNIQTRRLVKETIAIGIDLKKKYIEKGVITDDLGEGNWGCPIIDQGHMSWIENETHYDPTDPISVEGLIKLQEETNREVFEKRKISFPKTSIIFVALSKNLSPHDLIRPLMNVDYTVWQRKVKRIFDPNNAADPSTYIGQE